MVLEVAVGVVLGIIGAALVIVLLPMLLRAVMILLDCAIFAALAYVGVEYVYAISGMPVPVGGRWWIAFGMTFGASFGCFLGLYALMDLIQHGFRHHSWKWSGNINPGAKTPCQHCLDDESVGEVIAERLKRKVIGLSPWSRSANEVIGSIRTLPGFLLLYGGTCAAIFLGFVSEQPALTLGAGLAYLLVTAWSNAARPYRMLQHGLDSLGTSRRAILRAVRQHDGEDDLPPDDDD
jgi:hypothetical protein